MVDRRRAFIMILGLAISRPVRLAAQQRIDFDPIAFAKLRAGEIAREITASPRDPFLPAPSRDAVFDTGLLLQAGLRALLPIPERDGVALPGQPSQKDPPALVEAQENYKAVFQSGASATPAQEAIAVRAIQAAARQLQEAGFTELSRAVVEWLRKSGYAT